MVAPWEQGGGGSSTSVLVKHRSPGEDDANKINYTLNTLNPHEIGGETGEKGKVIKCGPAKDGMPGSKHPIVRSSTELESPVERHRNTRKGTEDHNTGEEL